MDQALELQVSRSDGHDAHVAPHASQVVRVNEFLFEFLGAILILVAFALAQFRGLDRHGVPYLGLNLVGSAILAVVAVTHRQWGFLLLQVVWSIVALWGLFGFVRRGAVSR